MSAVTEESKPTERREEGRILQDYAEALAFLVEQLTEAKALAKGASDGIWKRSDISEEKFRKAERAVYAVYRHVGTTSALLEELSEVDAANRVKG